MTLSNVSRDKLTTTDNVIVLLEARASPPPKKNGKDLFLQNPIECVSSFLKGFQVKKDEEETVHDNNCAYFVHSKTSFLLLFRLSLSISLMYNIGVNLICGRKSC